MDSKLLDILACPVCKGPLLYLKPQQQLTLVIHGSERFEIPVLLRIDTPIEVDYYRHGGILPFVLRELLAG